MKVSEIFQSKTKITAGDSLSLSSRPPLEDIAEWAVSNAEDALKTLLQTAHSIADGTLVIRIEVEHDPEGTVEA